MLSWRERFIALAAAAAATLLAVDQVIVGPLLARQAEARVRIEQAQADLLSARRRFENQDRARRAWRSMARDTLTGNSSDAEAQVLRTVRNAAQDAGLTINSIKPERRGLEAGLGKVSLRAAGQGSMGRVAGFLAAVEGAAIPLRITDVQIAPQREGTDDLLLQIGLETIFLPAPTRKESGSEGRP